MLAMILVVLAAILVPRPNVRLTSVRYQTGPCDPSTTTFVATAIVTLMNDGGAEGAIYLRFKVDGLERTTAGFFVPAHTTLERAIDVVIGDCSSHVYSVEPYVPMSPGFLRPAHVRTG